MAKKPVPEELDEESRKWAKRLKKAQSYQETYSKNWKTNEQLIYGRDPSKGDTGLVVSYGYGLCKSLETAIYVQDAEGIVEAYDESKKEVARRWTNVVNYDMGVMDLKSKGNIGLMDNFIYGYFACIETLENTKCVRYPDEDKKSKKEKPEEAVVAQDYIARRINPWDILFDPQGTLLDLSDHRYGFVAFYPTISQLEEDPCFTHLPENIETFPESSQFTRREKPPGMAQYSRGDSEKDPEFKTICVWEIWDKNGWDEGRKKPCLEILYMTDHQKKIIGRQKLPFDLNVGGRRFFPITLMAFNPSPIGFYPTPEVDLIASQLTMINELDAIIYADARTKWRKYAAFADLVSPEEAAKISDPNPANCIINIDPSKLDQLGGTGVHQYPDINNIIGAIRDPAPKQDLIAVREMCIQEIFQIIGYGPSDRGGMPKTRSAREAMAIKEKMEARLHLRADAVTTFYRNFINKHMQIVGQTLEVERYEKVFTSDGDGYKYLKYTKDDIQGEFDFVVFAGSSMPRNTESKRASERELANMMFPIAQKEGLPLEPIFERVAEAYQWKNWQNLFKNHKQFLKQLAMMFFAIKEHGKKVPPDQMLNLAAQVIMSGLNQAEIGEIKAALQGGQPGQQPGSAPPAKPRGDQAPNKTEMGVA